MSATLKNNKTYGLQARTRSVASTKILRDGDDKTKQLNLQLLPAWPL